MADFRVSRAAKADLATISAASEQRRGTTARRRYETLLAAAMRKVADDPYGPATRSRSEIARRMRSFHPRHARSRDPDAAVRQPAHVIYYRVVAPEVIEIVRVLHERMESSRHIKG